MCASENTSFINVHGQFNPCEPDGIDIDSIDELRGIVKPEYTGQLFTLETPVVIKTGDKTYSLLNLPAKFIHQIERARAGKLYCVILKNVTPEMENVLRVLLSYLPPSLILYTLPYCARLVMSCSGAMAYLKKSHIRELHGNSGKPKLLRKVFGFAAMCDKTVTDNDPEKYHDVFLYWDEKARTTGDLSYDEILALITDKKERKKFPGNIRKYMKQGRFDNFFNRYQHKVKEQKKEAA